MRVHASSDDPDYWHNHFRECPTVRRNGVILDHVIEADDVADYAVVYVWNNDGPAHDGERLLTQRLTGGIRIAGERL